MASTSQNISCIILNENEILCNNTVFDESDRLTYHDKLFWIYLAIYVALVLVAGLMSGLTMGLLSLDVMSLTVLADGGKPHEQKYAKKILPLVKRHHLLLVTLLLSNAAAVESMPLFLDKISSPVIAIVVSVTAVLIFGEVVPQAICTRYGLAIGATLSPLVILLMIISLPISWPLSKLLDCILGTEHGTFFRRAELSVLVDLHKEADEENEDPLTADEAMIIKGALSMRDKAVGQICTPLESVFALNINKIMDKETMNLLLTKGHSRVPIYEESKQNLLGLVLVKNLIKIDPDDNLPLREVFQEHRRPLLKVSEKKQLYDVLNLFQTGKSHMFVVVHANELTDSECSELKYNDEVIGIITLEDVIEELIQEEIIDETDVYVDVHKKIKVAKARAAMLSLSQSTRSDASRLPANNSASNDEYESDTQPLLQVK
ncbi:unnamed protein product [Clavelina lepadiformis]|uniref:Uncharacterized protein n=1 Tax=Clavelina lepadiformis TaxID=159417 RepID=A0ABP0H4U5_CLALP